MKSIYGNRNKHVFIFSKKNNFFSLLEDFLIELGFINPLQYMYLDETGTKPEELTSTHWDFKNDTYDIDIVFSKENIALFIRTDVDRDVFLKSLLKVVK